MCVCVCVCVCACVCRVFSLFLHVPDPSFSLSTSMYVELHVSTSCSRVLPTRSTEISLARVCFLFPVFLYLPVYFFTCVSSFTRGTVACVCPTKSFWLNPRPIGYRVRTNDREKNREGTTGARGKGSSIFATTVFLPSSSVSGSRRNLFYW